MAHDIFISYAHENKVMADALCATLERAGLRCWIAPRDVPPGNWGGAIVEAIEASRVFVLVFSSESNKSPQVLREVERAVSLGLTVVPVRVQDVVPSKDIAYFIGSVHWLDAMTPPIERQLDAVAQKLKSMLGASPPPKARPEPVRRGGPSKGLVIGVVAVVCVLVGLVIWHFRPGQGGNGEVSPTPGPAGGHAAASGLSASLANVEAEQGSGAQLRAVAEGAGPITFIWQAEDRSGAWTTMLVSNAPLMNLKNVGLGDDRQYRVIVTNASGAATSAPARLAVKALAPPTMTREPENVVCKEGQDAEFRAEAQGKGILTYEWQFQGGQGDWKPVGPGRESTLSLAKVALAAAGQYRLVAANLGGASTSSPARLTVVALKPARFIKHPANVTVGRGERAVLEAVVEGDDASASTWEFQAKGTSAWRPLTSASGFILTLPAVTPEDEGAYRCVLKSATGPMTSQAATVALVVPKPALDVFYQTSGQPGQAFISDQVLSAFTNALAANGAFRLKNPAQKIQGRPRSSAEYVCTLKLRVNLECRRSVENTSGQKPVYYYTPSAAIDVLWELNRADGGHVAGDHFPITKAGARFVTRQNENPREIAEAKGLYPINEAIQEAKQKLTSEVLAVRISP